MTIDKNLMEFYGIGCDHCDDMKPRIAQVEAETGKRFAKYEVWQNEKNLQILQKIDKGMCGGIPFFYNRRTRDYICGATSTENLKNWALGRPHEAFTQGEKKPFSMQESIKEWKESAEKMKQTIQDIQGKLQSMSAKKK
eukprot:CAMPEP_0196655930 /NCGR_PEP_ID=MMETSP1086-20130531/11402_1 /TAXON_ID=77921 /ORGANISM="Cyanoptyche  gloeocystis , Strain SAG4.97" /LENGTH=138 /DNA_ID=CAMNT_0041988479 /DNA_START=98 /DNA_END=514 /DNA_ORIENTATION=-